MLCETCLSFTGISAEHSRESCPVLPTLKCRRCHCHGHTTAECGESWVHWERPTTLEELIPTDIRQQWNIVTTTEILFPTTTSMEEWKREAEVSKQDKPMREFMRKNEIPTTHDMESNLQRIREWCARKGMRLRIV